jgi:hypothetical protein
MEKMLKQILTTMKESLAQTERLVKDLEESIRSLEPNKDPPKPVEEKPAGERREKPRRTEDKPVLVEDVTIEMLREMATKYSAAFGMERLLALNMKHGSAKKLSGIDPKMYGVLYGAMGDELAKASEAAVKETVKEEPKKAPEGVAIITIEYVREKAAAFLTAHGQASLQALLKAFGAGKISELDKAKYPAFLEAISNA